MSAPTTASRTLRVELLDTWHVGTGRGEGHHLDAALDLDADVFPHLPGRMVRGLLRDACDCVESWGHASAGDVDALFGTAFQPGLLNLSSARLHKPLRHALLAGDTKPRGPLSKALRLSSFQTALDHHRGTALPQSLRGIELAIPMVLEAAVEIRGKPDIEIAAAWQLLDLALPLVLAVGANKTRGHGRARLSWSTGVDDRGNDRDNDRGSA